MKPFINKLFVYSLLTFILVYFLSVIWKLSLVDILLSSSGLVMLVSALILLPKQNLKLPFTLIVFSLLILYVTSASPIVLWNGLREMSAVVPLIVLVSLVSWMIGHRPYVIALMTKMNRYITSSTRFFTLVAGTSHIISSFMAVGGVPFVYQMFRNTKRDSVSQNAWDFTISTAIMRGFTLTVLWATVHPAFVYAVAGTDAPLMATVLKGIGLTGLGFMTGILLFRLQMKKNDIPDTVMPNLHFKEQEPEKGLVGKFFFWIFVLMGGIFLSIQWLKLDILLAVPVVIMMVTTLYFFVNKEMSTYKQRFRKLITIDFENKKKEMVLILSAGLLVGTLKETGYGHVLFAYFLSAIDFVNINILIGLTLVVIVLGFCGFPPIPAMILLSGILVDIPGGYSTDVIALSLLLGVSVTLVTAPVTVPLLLISSQNGRSLAENGIGWNLGFGVLFLLIGLAYIQLLTIF
ncbi:hypothetical protein [Halalkalibacter krulwichiae]|uniref:Uncharacterized protein n=1 Tax=Halalkalibacter krulwichiae TaxID=199441 RepID=A0A1X9MC15_9BACI|nr:hypothetical protein [Halalkalibacter krulwichiae]ARK30184.1 hypothetical protein BkAM31D_10175 [Halalkalibacter krulwichiae]